MEFNLSNAGNYFTDTAKGIGDAMTGALVNGIPRVIDAEIDRKIKVSDPATTQKTRSDVTGQTQQTGTIAPPSQLGLTQKQVMIYGGIGLGVVVLIILATR